MTENPLATHGTHSDVQWHSAYGAYILACGAMQRETAMAVHHGAEIDPIITEEHSSAASALIETPARTVLNIAQKIRVADNLLNLDQHYPRLAELLLADLLAVLGVGSGDARILPYPLN